MGHSILQTPNIDKMASEGSPIYSDACGRQCLCPDALRADDGSAYGPYDDPCKWRRSGTAGENDVTVAEMLKAEGYATGGFGKWGLGDAGTTGVPEKHGFDTFFGYYHQVHAHTYYPRYLLHNSEKMYLEGKYRRLPLWRGVLAWSHLRSRAEVHSRE